MSFWVYSYCGNMTSYRFFKMAAADAKYYFRFRICWYRCLQKVKVYQQTKFRRHISTDGWDITTSGFLIQTSAILEYYFWFRPRPVCHNLHNILHHATEFRPNRSTRCRNMTSYPFLKMAAATAEYYFRFRICWCHCLEKVKVYQQTNFRQNISIGGWDITTSGFLIQTAAILEFYFWFRSPALGRNLHRLPNFVQIGAPTAKIWRHIYLSRWRPRPLNTTAGFVLVDVTAFRTSKSNSKPNFVEISPLVADI